MGVARKKHTKPTPEWLVLQENMLEFYKKTERCYEVVAEQVIWVEVWEFRVMCGFCTFIS